MLSNWCGTHFSLDFSSHRQSSTGSVVVTATCATKPLSQSAMKKQKDKRLLTHVEDEGAVVRSSAQLTNAHVSMCDPSPDGSRQQQRSCRTAPRRTGLAISGPLVAENRNTIVTVSCFPFRPHRQGSTRDSTWTWSRHSTGRGALKTVEMPQVQLIDKLDSVVVSTQEQVPAARFVQRTVEKLLILKHAVTSSGSPSRTINC